MIKSWMLFNSYMFLFAFLPLALAGYYGAGKWFGKWAALKFLVLASLVFYSYWNPRYTLLIIGSIVFNYYLAKLEQRTERGKRLLLIAGVTVNLSILGYFKYAQFAVTTIHELTGLNGAVTNVVLPLAISFFTFTQIAYIVDVYRGLEQSYSFREYCFFVLFFPHLIAGPIVRHYEILPQLEGVGFRYRWDYLSVGLTMFILGLGKKVLLADTVAPTASEVFGMLHQGFKLHFALAWAGSLAYTCQLYFDFSGYSDMAIGLGYMFGIKLPLNFNSPYKAASMIEFWRRWHISLSRFLRDYLYISLGGNRGGSVRRYLNLFVTMLLGGLWHGAGWTFVLWGGLHGLYLAVNHSWRAVTRDAAWAQGKVIGWSYHLLTFLAVVAGWVVFKSESLHDAARMLKGMAGINGFVFPRGAAPWIPTAIRDSLVFDEMGISGLEAVVICVLLAIVFLLPNTQELMSEANPALDPVTSRPRYVWKSTPAWACAVGALFALVVLSLGHVSEFLYFQF